MEKRNIQTKTISHLRDARSILGDEILKEIDETEGLSVENIEIAKAIHSFTKTHPYFNRSAGEFGWNDFWGNFVSGLLSLDEGDPSSALWHFQDMKDVLYGHLYDIVKDAMFFEGIALFELGKFEEAKAVFLNCHEELKDSPDLDNLKNSLLGTMVKVKGRTKMNQMFNRLEFVARNIKEADPVELLKNDI